MNGWSNDNPLTAQIFPGIWCPRAASVAAHILDRPLNDVIDEYGETVLIRETLNGFEVRRMPPAPDSPEVRAEVTEIIGKARRKQAESILGRVRHRDLGKAGAVAALHAIGYNKADATKLTDMARPRVSIHAGPAGTQPASLTDIINVIDWNRINAGLTYALLHGGNLPPGFMDQNRRGGA